MKKSYTLSLLLMMLVGFTFSSKAQSTYALTGIIDSVYYGGPCDSLLSLSMTPEVNNFSGNHDYNLVLYGNNFSPGVIDVTVSWGDGTVTSHTGQMTQIGSFIQFSPALDHLFTGNSTYTVSVTAVNQNTQTSVTQDIIWSPSNCVTHLYGMVNVDCDNDGQVDTTLSNGIPYQLIGNNGTTLSNTLYNGMSTFYQGITAGTYSVVLDQGWLSNHGYIQTSSSPSTFYITPGGTYTFMTTVICDSSGNNNFGCVGGQIFCDNNGNGVFDANDSGISGAPITVSYNNSNYNTWSDNNGIFYQGFPNANQGPATVTVNAQWLSQNGYYLPNNTHTTTNTICDSTSFFAIPFAVNCDSANVQDRCVKGIVFCDANGNGVMDSTENVLPQVPVTIYTNSAGGNNVIVYSNANGLFTYMNPNLPNNVVIQVSQSWLNQHGYSSNVSALTVSTDCDSNGLAYYPINCGSGGTGCADLHTEVSPWIGYYQNQNNYIKLKWGNYGFSPVGPYKLTLTYPAGVTPNTSTFQNQSYTITGNTVEWTLNNNSSSFYQQDVISFFVPSGLPSGTMHHYSATITPLGNVNDCDSTNNQDTLMMILGNSYDPNDKTVYSPEIIDPGVQDLLEYRIRFQNTGTAPAQDIYIIDTLSPLLDLSTFELLDASHNIQVIDLGGGVMKFNFPGIWLPDSTTNEPDSHGELRYRIKENVGNGIGTTITNTAYIYFDWNPAIITNTTVNKNMTAGIVELVNQDWVIYPNPAKSVLHIRADFNWERVNVYSVDGKLMLSSAFTSELNLEELSNGMYMIELQAGDQKVNTRFIKE